MVSEVEKVLKGRFEATPEYENTKKVIGVSNANITPDATGVCLLGKQSAFMPAESAPAMDGPAMPQMPDMNQSPEMPGMDQNPGMPEMPQMPAMPQMPGSPEQNGPEMPQMPNMNQTPEMPGMGGTPDMPNMNQGGPNIPAAPAIGNTIVDNPLEMAPTNELETLIPNRPEEPMPQMPNPMVEAAPVEEQKEEAPAAEEIAMPALDIQMPALDTEVVASEPTGVNEALFSSSNNNNNNNQEQNNVGVVTQAVGPSLELEVPALDIPVLGNNNNMENAETQNNAPAQEMPNNTNVEMAGQNNNNNQIINEIISKKMDEFVLVLNKNIKEQVETFKKEMTELLNNNNMEMPKEEVKNEAQPTEVNVPSNMPNVDSPEANLMNDALSQIENLVAPMDQGIPSL